MTRFWKMGLIAHYAILSYGLPKSTQVYLAKIEFLLQHDSLNNLIPKSLLGVLLSLSYNVFLPFAC